jgi:hypothetical protein
VSRYPLRLTLHRQRQLALEHITQLRTGMGMAGDDRVRCDFGDGRDGFAFTGRHVDLLQRNALEALCLRNRRWQILRQRGATDGKSRHRECGDGENDGCLAHGSSPLFGR